VQFTPDLLPSDITGSSVFDQRAAGFEFHPGPVFTNLLLGDEINRAPPKTQAALLEAMEEHQVTADDGTHALERPFLVLATQNPIEYEGTYPLPEAQLDRFLVRLRVGYLQADEEWRMLDARARRGTEAVALKAIVDRSGLLTLQAAVEAVHVGEAVGRYRIELTAATRNSSEVEVGASPRGSLALLRLARARAAFEGRDFVLPDDVKAVAAPALAHRIVLRPELWVQQVSADDVVREVLARVPTPSAEDVVAAQ
jgi:MoxR-like ATPase